MIDRIGAIVDDLIDQFAEFDPLDIEDIAAYMAVGYSLTEAMTIVMSN